MKNTKRLTAIMTTAILVSLMASSLVASAETIKNYNPNQGTTSSVPSYMDSSKSTYAAAAKYGDLLSDEYEWADPHGNTPDRNGYNPGPAPDRPDVLWRTNATTTIIPKVILGTQTLGSEAGGVNAPFLVSVSSGVPMAMAGQLIIEGSIRVNATNATTRTAAISLNPHSGAVNWASIMNLGPTAGVSTGTAHAGTRYIFKVDDTHFAMLSVTAGLAMFNIDGRFLWRDTTIIPSSVYHAAVVAQAPLYRIFGPRQVPGEIVPWMGGWDLSAPDTDKNTYNSTELNRVQIRGGRNLWNYTIDEPGYSSAGRGVQLCYGDGRIYMGSYSSCAVYALNATTGEKIWETFVESYVGYMSTYAYGKLYVGCQSMHIYAFNGTTGEVVWHNTDGLGNRAFNVWNLNAAYGRIYLHDLGFGRTGAQKCLDAETGKMLWASTELNEIGYYQTVIGDGKIYGNQADGSKTTGRTPDPTNFACWDAFTGEVIWTIKANIPVPVLAYGCLYFVLDSQLWAISTVVGAPVDWTMWRGNVETPSFTLNKGPVDLSSGPKWTFRTGAAILSSPVVAKGKIYFNSNDGYTYCLDAYNGSMIWRHATNEPKMTTFGSTPAVVSDKVIVGPDDGNLYILDALTGEELRKVPMGTYTSLHVGGYGQHSARSSPIIYNNQIYVASVHNNKTYCLDLNGNTVWSTDLGDRSVGSAAIAGGYVYIMAGSGRMYKLNSTGGIALNFSISGVFTATYPYGYSSYTPTVVGDRLWVGTTSSNLRCYNTTTGNLIYATLQPNIATENVHGACVYVPDWALTARNATSGQTFGNIGGKIIGQAGPTVACARADNGSNIWSAWGGWEVWSSVVFSGIGNGAVIYFGSDSYGIQVLNASTGTPISWYTAGGNIASSPAIWDGKLYVGSYDNKLYCFEDHPTQEMAISMSLDKITVDLNNTESVTVTAQLTHVPSLNPYEEIGRAAPVPGLPNASVLVTFTDPDGVDTNMTAVTDTLGWATVTFTPNKEGTWKAIAWYTGEDHPTFSYGYAFSDQVPIKAAYTITEPEKPVEPTTTNIPVEYVYAAIAVIVIVIIAAAALMLLRKRKK